MNDQDIRRQNLKDLIADDFGGNASLLCRAINRSASQINDLLAGRKSFGEKFARSIEPLLNKEPKWFDAPHSRGSAGADPGFIQSVSSAAADRDIPEHIKQSILTLISSSPKKTDAK